MISRDWWKDSKPRRPSLKIETVKAKTVDDLPEILTAKEVAPLIKVGHYKTVEKLWREKKMRSFKLGGKRVTTAEYVAEYYLKQIRKSG